MGKNRRRIYALIGAAAVAGALLVVAPALGDHQGGSVTQVEFRAFGEGGPRIVAAGHDDQLLVTKNNACDLADNGTLLKIEGDNRGPGIANSGIGVKSSGSNSNGTPCSQIDSKEKLTIRPGSSLPGRAFSGVELDLEMAGNAIVLMTFSPASGAPVTYELHTGTSFPALCATTQDGGAQWPGCSTPAGSPTVVTSETGVLKAGCNAPQNSGPNSGANDNCIWIVTPGFDATRIDLTTSTVSGGTVSLEGGSDTNRASIFYLADSAPVATDQVEYIDYTEDINEEPAPHFFDLDASGLSLTVVSLGYTDDTDHFHSGVTRAGGSVSVDPGGDPLEVTYTPPKDFTGSDLFEYTVIDSAGRTASATVTIYEMFNCGETLGLSQYGVTANYTRLFPVDKDACDDDGKPYDLSIEDSDPPVVVFVPRSVGDPLDCSLVECPRFSAELIFPPRPATPGVSNTGTLEYWPDATDDAPDWYPMPWCESSQMGTEGSQRVVSEAELPAGSVDGWCIGFVETRPAVEGDFEGVEHLLDGDAEVEDFSVTTWYVYGIGDPLKRVS